MKNNGFESLKNNGIYTKCENGHIYTIIKIDAFHYNCYYDDILSAKMIYGLENAIKHFE